MYEQNRLHWKNWSIQDFYHITSNFFLSSLPFWIMMALWFSLPFLRLTSWRTRWPRILDWILTAAFRRCLIWGKTFFLAIWPLYTAEWKTCIYVNILGRMGILIIAPIKRGIQKFFYENICCGSSLEVPCWGTSNEYPQHIFLLRNKKNIYTFLWKKVAYLELCQTIFFFFFFFTDVSLRIEIQILSLH